jgi:hypothetical protein
MCTLGTWSHEVLYRWWTFSTLGNQSQQCASISWRWLAGKHRPVQIHQLPARAELGTQLSTIFLNRRLILCHDLPRYTLLQLCTMRTYYMSMLPCSRKLRLGSKTSGFGCLTSTAILDSVRAAPVFWIDISVVGHAQGQVPQLCNWFATHVCKCSFDTLTLVGIS